MQMKVGFTADCSDGTWEKYQSDYTVMSPVINGSVLVSVEYRDYDYMVSECYTQKIEHDNPDDPQICETNSEVCNRTPRVTSPGVVTLLLALGDELNQQLVINNSSAEVMAETAVSFASPLVDPKILVVRAAYNYGESYEDTDYIANHLLKLYSSVTLIDEGTAGLQASDLAGYDLIWYNNPGYPMAYQQSRDALMAFSGGVVLSGDDMAWGQNFSLTPLTGLTFVDNGTSVTCGGVTYGTDNNAGEQYQVSLSPTVLPGFPTDIMNFNYGNDIDNTVAPENASLQVIAWAKGAPQSCTAQRPTMVSYQRHVSSEE